MTHPPFKDYLFNCFVEWEKLQPGLRSSFSAYARWLSDNSYDVTIKQQLVSYWIKGSYEPSEEKYVLVLAEKLGDEVYEILDREPPDPLLQALNSRWDRIPPDKKQKLVDLSEQYEIKDEQQRIQETPKRRKKAPNK